MRHTCIIAIAIAALIAGMALPGASPAESHDRPYRAEEPDRPVASNQPPVKRQNFRARRADEIPPWEGFEDCPWGMPCVGIMAPTLHPWRR